VRARLHGRLGVAPPRPEIHLVAVSAPGDLASAAGLLREYRSAVGSEACFAGFEAEVEGLPGPYAAPGGRLFLARDGDALAGCGALRPLAPGVAEMRRMWTRPAFRGRGVGRALAEAIVAAAREEGYGALRLETLPGMAEAQALYRSLGFREIPPYVPAAAPGTLFMELGLRPGAASAPAAVR
jgi:ribosomal protein S18 acetylase RimI-like enzyme